MDNIIEPHSPHQIYVNLNEYCNFLTRLGIVINHDVEMWLDSNSDDSFRPAKELHFFTQCLAVQFTKAVIVGDVALLDEIYTKHRCHCVDDEPFRHSANIELFFTYHKITQWDRLSDWLTRQADPATLCPTLIQVRWMILEEKDAVARVKAKCRTDAIESMIFSK